jgi:hypothetical protein
MKPILFLLMAFVVIVVIAVLAALRQEGFQGSVKPRAEATNFDPNDDDDTMARYLHFANTSEYRPQTWAPWTVMKTQPPTATCAPQGTAAVGSTVSGMSVDSPFFLTGSDISVFLANVKTFLTRTFVDTLGDFFKSTASVPRFSTFPPFFQKHIQEFNQSIPEVVDPIYDAAMTHAKMIQPSHWNSLKTLTVADVHNLIDQWKQQMMKKFSNDAPFPLSNAQAKKVSENEFLREHLQNMLSKLNAATQITYLAAVEKYTKLYTDYSAKTQRQTQLYNEPNLEYSTQTPTATTSVSTPTPYATTLPTATSIVRPTPYATTLPTTSIARPTPYATTSVSTPTPYATTLPTTSVSTPTPYATTLPTTSVSTPTPYATTFPTTSVATPTPYATTLPTTSVATPTPYATTTPYVSANPRDKIRLFDGTNVITDPMVMMNDSNDQYKVNENYVQTTTPYRTANMTTSPPMLLASNSDLAVYRGTNGYAYVKISGFPLVPLKLNASTPLETETIAYVGLDTSTTTKTINVIVIPPGGTNQGISYVFKTDGTMITSSTFPEKTYNRTWNDYLAVHPNLLPRS